MPVFFIFVSFVKRGRGQAKRQILIRVLKCGKPSGGSVMNWLKWGSPLFFDLGIGFSYLSIRIARFLGITVA